MRNTYNTHCIEDDDRPLQTGATQMHFDQLIGNTIGSRAEGNNCEDAFQWIVVNLFCEILWLYMYVCSFETDECCTRRPTYVLTANERIFKWINSGGENAKTPKCELAFSFWFCCGHLLLSAACVCSRLFWNMPRFSKNTTLTVTIINHTHSHYICVGFNLYSVFLH